MPQLSMDTHDGEYVYRGGVTPGAIGAFVPAALAPLAVALLPVFQAASEFSWFIGAGLGALCYLVTAKREFEYTDQHGEAIAVAASHRPCVSHEIAADDAAAGCLPLAPPRPARRSTASSCQPTPDHPKDPPCAS
ncbi:hypothetical protein [Kocuria marina]|uniref:hypothetical protein n=1 Tax=Kocuria marina TaxID=223184 RepID=UPI001643F44B|nr:hypothetical protein [Kocuria indica]